MSRRNHKLICFILAFFVLAAGMCFENVKTDSSFACPSRKKSDFNVCTVKAGDDRGGDPTEWIQRYSGVAIRQTAGMIQLRVKGTKLLSGPFGIRLFSFHTGKLWVSAAFLQFCPQSQNELVADYLHKSDGKKRI